MADKKTLEARANAAQRLADALERVAAATNASAESQLESAKAATAAAKANQELQLSQEGNEAAIDASIEETNRQTKALKELEDQYKATSDKQTKFANVADGMGSELAGLIPIIGGNKDIMGSFAGQLFIASKEAGGMTKGLSQMLGSLTANITGVQGWTNVLSFSSEMMTGVILSAFQMGIEIQGITAGFNKATGAAGAFDESMMKAFRSTTKAGVSFEEQAAATQALFTETVRFTGMSESAQLSLMETTAVLGEFGVDVSTSAQNLNIMTTSLGMTSAEAEETSRRLLTAAQSMGVAPAEMAADFAAAGKQFASFGENAVDAFIDLKEMAKKTGIELQSLLGVTEKFTTFEGAADSVGSLNALLGGPFLNTIDMVTLSLEDPAKAMQEVRNAVLDAGLSFEDMNPAMRRAVAEAAGLEDASQLAALMSGELDGLGSASSESAEQLAELKKATEFTQTLSEEIEATRLAWTANFKPIIDIAIWFLNIMQGVAEWLNTNLGEGGAAIVSFVIGFGLMKLATWRLSLAFARMTAPITVLSTEIGALTLAMGGMATASVPATPAITAVGTASGAAGKHMLLLGAAVALIGAGIFLAAAGMGLFILAVKGMTFGELAGIAGGLVLLSLGFGVLIQTMSLLAPIAPVAIAVLMGMGTALYYVAGAIALAAIGMALFASSIGSVGEAASQFEKIGDAFESLTVAKMATFTVAMTATAAAGMTPGGAMLMAAGAMMINTKKESPATNVDVKVTLEGKAEKLFEHKSTDTRYVKKNEVTPNASPSPERL